MKKIILAATVTFLVVVGCKQETKEPKKEVKTEVSSENIQEATFAISGMTCEIGCAKLISSKLSKVEGVIEADVVFADSIANVKFDKTKTDAKKLMAYVDGMANNMYKTSEVAGCSPSCKKEGCKEKKECEKKCSNECKSKEKKACKDSDKKDCCKDKANKTTSSRECCTDKKV